MKEKGQCAVHCPSCFRHRLRRSGCFPALPYSPSWQRYHNTV